MSICLEMFVQVELVTGNALDSLDRKQEARAGKPEGNVGRMVQSPISASEKDRTRG